MNDYRIELNPTQTVLVIGGRGFIGRSIVEQLDFLGAHVIIGSRCTYFNPQQGTRRVRLHEITTQKHCDTILKGVDIVINAVGILRQRIGETYEQIHHQAVAHLVNACAEKKIRFVHVSALGLYNPTKSRFLSSKRLGEIAIQESKADWYLCRPSLVDGDGGYGAKWFRRVAQWPIHITPANATAILAPIHVEDLGEAIAKIALTTSRAKTNQERIYELGGEHKMNVLGYLQTLKKRPAALSIKIPAWVARLTSHFLDLFHLTPFSFGHYELLKFDNCPKEEQTTSLLGRRCRAVAYQGYDCDEQREVNSVRQQHT